MRTIGVGVLLILALAWLGQPTLARAQEHIMVAGVSLHLGMSKDEVLRKLNETAVTFKKDWDQGGCEEWLDRGKEAEGRSVGFCGGKLVAAGGVGNTSEGGAPLADALINMLGDLKSQHNSCTISAWPSGPVSGARITCGQLHVDVTVVKLMGHRLGSAVEALGGMPFPSERK